MSVAERALEESVHDVETSFDASNEEDVCEATRKLLGRYIVVVSSDASEIKESTTQRVDAAFCHAYTVLRDWPLSKYTPNVFERWIDFHLFYRILRNELSRNDSLVIRLLRLFNAQLRSIWREFIREVEDKPKLGRSELGLLTRWTSDFAERLQSQSADAVVSQFCREAREKFTELSSYCVRDDIPKALLRRKGMNVCGLLVLTLYKNDHLRDLCASPATELHTCQPSLSTKRAWYRVLFDSYQHQNAIWMPLRPGFSSVNEWPYSIKMEGNLDSFIDRDILEVEPGMTPQRSAIGKDLSAQCDRSDDIERRVEEELRFSSPRSDVARERTRASLKLQFTFPGEHVAYFDTWIREPRPQLQRTVVAHSRDREELNGLIHEWKLQNSHMADQPIVADFVAGVEADHCVPTPSFD